MAQHPQNQKLWDMVVVQAKARFNKYPTPASSHWVHQQYIKYGGKFVVSDAQSQKRQKMFRQMQEQIAKKHMAERKKKKNGKD